MVSRFSYKNKGLRELKKWLSDWTIQRRIKDMKRNLEEWIKNILKSTGAISITVYESTITKDCFEINTSLTKLSLEYSRIRIFNICILADFHSTPKKTAKPVLEECFSLSN